MLSHDQERALELIGAQTTIEDPRFAQGLTAGRPRRPRQYRAWRPLFELVLATLLIVGAAMLNSTAGIAVGVATVLGLGAIWARRRLCRDRPSIRRA